MSSELPQGLTLEELHERLADAVKFKKFNLRNFFEPVPKQREFFRLGASHWERMLMAGNGNGKTEAGAFEFVAHVTGDYPPDWEGYRFKKPINAWQAGTSGIEIRDSTQKKLFGQPGNEEAFGTGMFPKDAIVGKPTPSRSAQNAYESYTIRCRVNGQNDESSISRVTVKSYDQDRTNWQGSDQDLFWPDEEPPIAHYTEGLARLRGRGIAYLTFTPLFGMSEVVGRFLDESDPGRAYVQMGVNDALWYTEEQRARQLASYPARERQARAYGDPLLGSGRVFGADIADMLIPPVNLALSGLGEEPGRIPDHMKPQLAAFANSEAQPALYGIPEWWRKLWGIDFGIDHPFAAALLAFDPETDIAYLLHNIRMSDAVPVQHAAAMKRIAPSVRVAWPHDGHERDKGSGKALSKIYAEEGLLMLPEHATNPGGGYGLYASVSALDTDMQAGRFKVAANCSEFISEYGQYHYKDGKIVALRDDVISAARAAHMMRRKAHPGPMGLKRTKRNRPTHAPILNPWTGRPVDPM